MPRSRKSTIEIGLNGEQEAIQWLRDNGFLIIDTNWRTGRYEIDIIAQKGGGVHFVEVKTRKAGGMTTPEMAMTPVKIKALLKAANLYISAYNIDADCHIDLIAIETWPDGEISIRYIPDAGNIRW